MRLRTAAIVADLIAVTSAVAFAVVVWWPAAFLVVTAAALAYSWRNR